MPDFILPAEADRCPHCDAVLTDPPDCCDPMRIEHSDEMHRQNPATFDDYDDCGDRACEDCYGTGCDESNPDDGTEDYDTCDSCGGEGYFPD